MRSPIVIVLLPSVTTVGGSRATPPLMVVIPARQLTSPALFPNQVEEIMPHQDVSRH
jgi:hypothetical protein